jgi:hypothetical protein|tara:strand:- start:443 stop:718 length:276 start_codon:yes stop_codon:yes gene_type:complete
MKIQMDLSSLSKLDLSKIPKNLLGILQDKELSMAQKMVAFNMFLPNLPASPEHDKAYDDNLEVGRTIKRLVDEGKIRLKFDKNFKLDVITN